MKTYRTGIFASMLLLAACSTDNSTTQSGNPATAAASPAIVVQGYTVGDSMAVARLDTNAVIQLKCHTGFPAGARFVIQKGLRINRTSADVAAYHTADTVVISGQDFEVPFPARFLGGYINFAVWPGLQDVAFNKQYTQRDSDRADLVYYSEYSINRGADSAAGPLLQIIKEH